MQDRHAIAEAVRRACVDAAAEAAEQAGMQGLCAEGRIEAAISAMQMLQLDDILAALDAAADDKRET